MKWTLKLVAEVVPGKPTEYEVATIERIEKFSPATVGLTISEGKAILAGLQKQMVTAQVQHHGASIHSCPGCGKAFRTKGYYRSTLRSVYGNVGMRIRRLRGCSCVGARQNSFSAMFTNRALLSSVYTVSRESEPRLSVVRRDLWEQIRNGLI